MQDPFVSQGPPESGPSATEGSWRPATLCGCYGRVIYNEGTEPISGDLSSSSFKIHLFEALTLYGTEQYGELVVQDRSDDIGHTVTYRGILHYLPYEDEEGRHSLDMHFTTTDQGVENRPYQAPY